MRLTQQLVLEAIAVATLNRTNWASLESVYVCLRLTADRHWPARAIDFVLTRLFDNGQIEVTIDLSGEWYRYRIVSKIRRKEAARARQPRKKVGHEEDPSQGHTGYRDHRGRHRLRPRTDTMGY